MMNNYFWVAVEIKKFKFTKIMGNKMKLLAVKKN